MVLPLSLGDYMRTMGPREAAAMSHREDRAFGLPAGSIRAALALVMAIGNIAGVITGYVIDGEIGALTLGAILAGPTAVTGTQYFTMGRGRGS